jgi:Bax protein
MSSYPIRQIPHNALFALCLGALLTLPQWSSANPILGPSADTRVPDFAALTDVSQRKQQFFSYLLPVIREINANILRRRQTLYVIADKLSASEPIDQAEAETFLAIARHFRYRARDVTPSDVAKLLARVDVVPPSLVLAQAANESAWGTSRFARIGNNYFGMWCYSVGCGVTPRARPEGHTYEVAAYPSVGASVASYVRNINTNRAYVELRDIRARIRNDNLEPNGVELAEGLMRYSQRGRAYVQEIQALILGNDLHRLTPTVSVTQI